MSLLFTFVTLVAVFMAGLGLYGLVSSQGLAEFVSRWRSQRGLWIAATVRILFGIALWLVAPQAHAPLALKILAGITIAAGVALPILGVARFMAVLDWWLGLPIAVQKAWMGFAAVLGVFLLWAIAG